MESALIGLLGVFVGALLAEYFRRRNRVEAYSQKIFERRLEVYEGLMKVVQSAYTIASEIIEQPDLTSEERLSMVSEAIHSIAAYTDENALFINTYVSAHTVAMAMGVEDIPTISDQVEREAAISHFRAQYKAAKQMILEDSGIHQINKHFKLVSRSDPKSLIIKRVKELERDAA
jgi:hypothetical protein